MACIDKLLMCQCQAKAGSHCFHDALLVWKNSIHFQAQSRALHTWAVTLLSTNLGIWRALAPVFARQFTEAFGIIFSPLSSCCLRLSRPHMKIWTLLLRPSLAGLFRPMLGSTVGLCSWSFLVGFWTNSRYFLREGELGSCG